VDGSVESDCILLWETDVESGAQVGTNNLIDSGSVVKAFSVLGSNNWIDGGSSMTSAILYA